MDIICVGILLTYLALVTMSQQHIADNVDVGEQTASDYSIVVEDPDPEATDPEEWRRYFAPFGHVTYVSVGVNNGTLLQLLARKRSVLMQLHREIEEEEEGQGGEQVETSFMDRVLASAKASNTYYQAVEVEEPDGVAEKGKEEGAADASDGGTTTTPHSFLAKMALQAGATPGGGGKRGSVVSRPDWAEQDEKQLDEMVEKELNSKAAQSWRSKEEEVAAKEAMERTMTDELWLMAQRLGVMRDAKYYRADMYEIERQIAVEMEKGPAKASKVS